MFKNLRQHYFETGFVEFETRLNFNKLGLSFNFYSSVGNFFSYKPLDMYITAP